MEFKRVPNITVNYIGDECLVVDDSNDGVHILNETAGWLLSLCEEFVSLDKTVEMARQRYTLPAGTDLAADLREIVEAMRTRGIAEVRDRVG